MKLLTSKNNPETLKVIIASGLSKKRLNVVFVSGDCLGLKSPKRIPQLVLDNGVHIFSSNSASKLLFPPSAKDEPSVNYYLDLEAAVIQPLTTSFAGKPDGGVRANLENVLNEVDKNLSSRKFLTGENITVADISLWSSIYPLATDAKQKDEFFTSKKNLELWFETIQRLPEVQEAIRSSSIEKGISSLITLASSHWIPVASLTKAVSSVSVSQQQFSPDSPARELPAAVSENEIKAAAEAWSRGTTRKPKPAVKPVLPRLGEKNILITSALPYVNNVPHLGNIIGCVLSADVFARYCRLRNYNTVYICGTDEYGTATETKALEEGLTPQQICDKYFKIHDAIYKWFNINFDFFGRTTTPEQTEICQDLFIKLNNRGFISSDSVEQLLCQKCDRYLADRFVEGTCPHCKYEDARGDQCDGCGHLINASELIKPKCKLCQQTPVVRYSKQFFLDLPKIEPMLKTWMEKTSPGWSHNAREIARAWINDGLKPRCITRDLKWGIPVPLEGYRDKVFYVWFDAPIGYISMTKQYTDKWKKWWNPDDGTEVKLYQFMAKDNVPFHSVMFPSTLLGVGDNFITVNHLFATEYLNYEDGKFSKSRGVGVFGTDAQDTGIPADIWRFYLLYVRPESQDSSFSWVDLAIKNNSELLSILGNFINRSLVFAEKNYNSKVPDIDLNHEDYQLLALINRELVEYISKLEKGKLREGIRHMLSIARLGNQFMQASQPWVLIKGTEEEKKRCATVIGLSCNLSCLLSILLHPYMPETSEVVRKQLNASPDVNLIEEQFTLLLRPGHRLGKPSPLFNKIEISQIEKLKDQFSGRQKSKTPDGAERVSKPSPAIADPSQLNDVVWLEAAVGAQGDLVRKMKASGKEKSEWQPQVTVLLELKKKLATAQANAKEATQPASNANQTIPQVGNAKEKTPPVLKAKEATSQVANDPASNSNIEKLEAAITEQGTVVRKLKESGADRSQWQPQLNILLDLKKQLAEIQGTPVAATSSSKKNKKNKK